MKKLMMLVVGAGAFVAAQGVTAKPAEALGWWGCGWGCGCKVRHYRPCCNTCCRVRHYRPRKCCW
jgi:hypothetical protein